jgi:hypothetical protein
MLREAERLRQAAHTTRRRVVESSDSESDEEEDLTPQQRAAASAPPARAPAPARAPPAAEKQQQGGRVDLGAGEGIGDFVRRNSYGTWRTVPGFAPEHVIVSSEGWVRVRNRKGLNPPVLGNQHPSGYRKVSVNSQLYYVHSLILRAFHGPRPSSKHTADHIAKYDGDRTRERGDNRACNLRWATADVQNKNQGKHKAKRNGKPIRVRRADWPTAREWVPYPSAKAAGAAIGIKRLGAVANSNDAVKSRKDAQGFRWLAEWAEPNEIQDDLPPDPDYVDRMGVSKPQPKEEWRTAIYSDGKPVKNFRVSNRGRAQYFNVRSNDWEDRFTPKPAVVYAMIGARTFHVAVFCSFGGVLAGDETVDHVDGDETNNLLSNLRAATKREQMLNRVFKPLNERSNSLKKRVGCRHRDWPVNTPPLEFASQHDAARALGLGYANIGKNINQTRHRQEHERAGQLMAPSVGGYIFHKVPVPTPYDDDWGPE